MKTKIKKSELKEMVRRLINEYLDYSPADYGYDYKYDEMEDNGLTPYDLLSDDEYDQLLQAQREEDAWNDEKFVKDFTHRRADFEDHALDESIKRLVRKYINKHLK
jgi:hypothetical protein|nr:MAG TPA: hypothetical protein [Ackermannviridae sp.]